MFAYHSFIPINCTLYWCFIWLIGFTAGRAGRYGSKFPVGEVTCFSSNDLPLLHSSLNSASPTLEVNVLLLKMPFHKVSAENLWKSSIVIKFINQIKWTFRFWYVLTLQTNVTSLLNHTNLSFAVCWTISYLWSHLHVFTCTSKKWPPWNIGKLFYYCLYLLYIVCIFCLSI